ncbi:L-lactate permease [Scenedesmus sp. PABB004]|nr:L-lactate permease [Scenedesmus sp. PABB004]
MWRRAEQAPPGGDPAPAQRWAPTDGGSGGGAGDPGRGGGLASGGPRHEGGWPRDGWADCPDWRRGAAPPDDGPDWRRRAAAPGAGGQVRGALMAAMKEAATLAELQQLVEHAGSLDHIHLAATAMQLGQWVRRGVIRTSGDRAVAQQLLRRVEEQLLQPALLQACHCRGLSNVVWAAGVCGYDGPLLRTCLARLLAPEQLRGANAQDLASAAHGAATAGVALEQGDVQRLLTALERQLGAIKPQDVANTLWAVARMGREVPQRQLEQLLAVLEQQLRVAKPQELANSLWAVATMGYEVPQAHLEHLLAALERQLGAAKPQELANTLWAVAKMGRGVPRPQLEQLLAALERQLGAASPQAVSNVLWAVASMGRAVPQRQLEQLLAALERQPGAAKPQELASTLWAVATMGCEVPQPQLEHLLAALERQLGTTKPQDVANTLWACGQLRHLPSQLLAALAQQPAQLERLLADSSAQAFANIALACAQLGHADERLLGPLLRRAVTQVQAGASWSGQDLANTCWAVAVLDLQQCAGELAVLARAASEQWGRMAPENLRQLHQVQLWATDCGLQLPGGGGGPGLGRALAPQQLQTCRAAWAAGLAARQKQQPSRFQREVFAALQRLPLKWAAPPAMEQLAAPDGACLVDITATTAGGARLAVEADGPTHFRTPGRGLMGETLFSAAGARAGMATRALMPAAAPPDATPWGAAASVLLCLAPVAFLLAVCLVRRLALPSGTALPAAAALLAAVRLVALASPPLLVAAAGIKGLLEAATPLSVIYCAILVFEAMHHTACLPWMMAAVKSLSAGQPLAEVFLIAWAFAYMVSGVGGFNTPIALAAPMLASLGHDPLRSLLAVLVLNTLASHLGSVGMAVWFGLGSLGLSHATILLVGLKSAVIVGATSFVIAPLAASFLVPWRALASGWAFVVLSIASAVLPTAAVAAVNAEFPVLLGGVTGVVGTTLLIYFNVGLPPRRAPAAHGAQPWPAAARAGDKQDAASPRARALDGLVAQLAAAVGRPGSRAALLASFAAAGAARDTELAAAAAALAAARARHPRAAAAPAADGGSGHGSEGASEGSSEGSDAAVVLVRPCPAAAAPAPEPADVVDALSSLATVSAPASYWARAAAASAPGDAGAAAAAAAAGDALGCEHWEDAGALTAALSGATIHHAALSGAEGELAQPDLERGEGGRGCGCCACWRCPPWRAGRGGPPGAALGEALCRTLPLWLTLLLLLVTRIPALRIQAALQSASPALAVRLGSLGTLRVSAALVLQLRGVLGLEGVNWQYQTLYVPALLPFVPAALATIALHRRDLAAGGLGWATPFAHAWRKTRGAASAVLGAMVLSELTSAGGTGSPAYLVGYYLSAWLGRGFLAASGFVGALGSFVSGSVLAGNMMTGGVQKVAAAAVGVPVSGILAVQVAGSCAGKMLCLSNILSATVLLNLQGVGEGKVVRRVAPIALLSVLLAQALGLMFTLGGLLPDAA